MREIPQSHDDTHRRGARRYGRTALVVVAALLLTAAPVSGAFDAGTVEQREEPQTADDFLAELRGYEEEPALEAYGELEVVRSQAVTSTQIGDLTDAEARRMRLVLATLDSFVSAHGLAEDGDYDASMSKAAETATAITDLRETGGSRYADLASLALDRFYERQGSRLFERARNAESTPERLSLLSKSASAFKRAGASQRFSELAVRESDLRSTFEADIATFDAATARASSFLDGCSGCESPLAAVRANPSGVYAQYVEARRVHRHASQAAAIAGEHSLTDRREAATSLAARSETALETFTVGSALLSLAYALVLAGAAALVGHRVGLWGRDARAARVGEIVPVVGWDDA